ncbi:hypothetical protein GLOIN_2v1766278 [Rhizophagus irregularis DAOM 181602=DAOM 197198]|nr:hypothetical protein GLOIN_2v1766278 [Rhizophagus irregularis DAOM 181602=DAOM 197198]
MIDTINNLFLETYQSYIDKDKTIGKDKSKHLIIHFYTAKDHDVCVNGTNPDLIDLKFHAHNLRQLKLAEDLGLLLFHLFKNHSTHLGSKKVMLETCCITYSASYQYQDIDLALLVLFFNLYIPKDGLTLSSIPKTFSPGHHNGTNHCSARMQSEKSSNNNNQNQQSGHAYPQSKERSFSTDKCDPASQPNNKLQQLYFEISWQFQYVQPN